MKELRIKIPIYNCRVIFKVTNKFLEYMRTKDIELELDVNKYCGLCTRINDKSEIYILVKKKEKNNWDTIVHESLHAVNHILHSRGVIIDTRNDEAQTYLLGFIINKIQKYL